MHLRPSRLPKQGWFKVEVSIENERDFEKSTKAEICCKMAQFRDDNPSTLKLEKLEFQ